MTGVTRLYDTVLTSLYNVINENTIINFEIGSEGVVKMGSLDWGKIKDLADQKATLLTITRVPFQIVSASENLLTIRVRSGEEHAISRSNLEKAVEKIRAGVVISGPKEYRDLVADDRPTYAWSILKELGWLKKK